MAIQVFHHKISQFCVLYARDAEIGDVVHRLRLVRREDEAPGAAHTCAVIAASASRMMDETRRGQVPGINLGADHFGKNKDDYFAEVEATEQKVNAVFRGSVNVPEKLRFDLQRCLDPGMAVRRADYEGRLAGNMRACFRPNGCDTVTGKPASGTPISRSPGS